MTKQDSLSIISHELKNAIQPILVISNIFKNQSLGEFENPKNGCKYAKMGDNLHEASLNLINLLDDLVKFGNASDQLTISPKLCDIVILINQTIESHKPLAAKKNISISFHNSIEKELIHTSIFDPIKIRQVLTNLVSNAIKYGNSDSKIRIILTNNTEKQIIIKIMNHGIGMTEVEIKKALNGEGTSIPKTVNNPEGLNSSNGIGLPLARELVEAQHGEIVIKSQKGVGTLVILKFPHE